MPVEANKTIVRRFFEEVFNQQSQRAAAELIDPALAVHHPMLPGGGGGIPEVMQMMGEFRRAFPDLSYTVDDLFGEDDKIAARWTARGTHRGDFKGIAATGRVVTVAGTDIFVIANGRIVETWVSSDLLGLMQQIGAIR